MANNSDTWIKEQLAGRKLQDTPENRRQLRAEYYETDPYGYTNKTPNKTVTSKKTDTSTTQGTAVTEDPDLAALVAAGGAASGGTSQFANTSYTFPARVINYTEENIKAAQADALTVGGKGTITSVPGARGRIIVYSGDQLVDEQGNIARGQYDENGRDLAGEYFEAAKNPLELQNLLYTMRDYGFYGDNKPSTFALSGKGLMSEDSSALQRFLNYSGSNARTWRAMLPIVQGQAKLVSGGGRTVSVVSTEDATKEFRRQSLAILGRMPTAAEISQAVKAIQQSERSRAASGTMDPTSLSTAAELAAQKAAPSEAAAQSVGNAMNRIFSLFGGR